ncbi:MAG: hypothetical protein ACTS27_08190, partial [Phycisphaerales bacterium]
TGLAFAAFRGGDWRRTLPRIYGVVGIVGGATAAFLGPVAWSMLILAVYAGALWAARIREDSGPDRDSSPRWRCADCGYDLRGLTRDRSPVCPECGHPLPGRARAVPLT